MKIRGNVWDLGNGYLHGEVWNLLGTLDGHYTVVFTPDAETILVYKHGDYGNNLVSYYETDFKGFKELTETEYTFFKETVLNTMESRYFKGDPQLRFHSQSISDYYFDIFGLPVYWNHLPEIKVK